MDIDRTRLPADQLDNVTKLITFVEENIRDLLHVERVIFTTLWMYIARASAPVTANNLKQRPMVIKATMDKLIHKRLIWFDTDLRAVLQCPPFSALHTAHEVKAFGWEATHECSFIDAPLALLIYGPNTWLNVQSTCPRSGEVLNYQVLLDSDQQLQIKAPAKAADWCVWIPNTEDGILSLETSGLRSRINAFHTQADYQTYEHYHAEFATGTLYTLPQAIYLSECLLKAYQQALADQ